MVIDSYLCPMSEIKPLSDRVVVIPPPPKEVTSGGLIIPQAYQTREPIGEVAAIGEAVTGIKVGDKVLYLEHSGVTVGDRIVLRKSDCLAVIG